MIGCTLHLHVYPPRVSATFSGTFSSLPHQYRRSACRWLVVVLAAVCGSMLTVWAWIATTSPRCTSVNAASRGGSTSSALSSCRPNAGRCCVSSLAAHPPASESVTVGTCCYRGVNRTSAVVHAVVDTWLLPISVDDTCYWVMQPVIRNSQFSSYFSVTVIFQYVHLTI